ncbi:MAG TPA: hypothetical protein PKW33_18300 [Anaerolineaceae bacterium]|nr:hypothetical protein [Anaerolineaceae bacterium]HPN53553.1 hypothetical protein [Anaerolineaceae bacterium]
MPLVVVLLLVDLILRQQNGLLLPAWLIMVLMILFMAVYPCIGNIDDEQSCNAVESLVQVLMIAYILILILVTWVIAAVQAGQAKKRSAS